VRVAQTQKLVAFIACTPALLYCHGTRVQPSQPEAKEDEATSSDDEPSVVEVNFLCVHKKLRSKRLAPVLIKEITRRVNVCGIFQARRPSPRFLRAPCPPARPPRPTAAPSFLRRRRTRRGSCCRSRWRAAGTGTARSTPRS